MLVLPSHRSAGLGFIPAELVTIDAAMLVSAYIRHRTTPSLPMPFAFSQQPMLAGLQDGKTNRTENVSRLEYRATFPQPNPEGWMLHPLELLWDRHLPAL